jgi:D-arabinose 1-dehydrogenase-like Zn-dependent alcohol dehydrogenase
MIAKSVGWTTGNSPSHPDAVEFDTEKLESDQVLVKINGHEANRADLGNNRCGEVMMDGPQEICRGVGGLVIEAGANALWYVDRSVIIPAGNRCGNCDAGQRDRAATRVDKEIADNDDDGTPAEFVVVRADELCVVSVTTDWRKPRSR